MEPVFIVLTTFNRQDLALKTIEGVQKNLAYPNVKWIIYDDGSDDPNYLTPLREVLGENLIDALRGNRNGVGFGMNYGLRRIEELGGELCLMLEDDWELCEPLDLLPHVNMLINDKSVGMIRLGYLSAGLGGHVVSGEDRLWLKLEKNTYSQYIYAGHPSLRSIEFHKKVGMFSENLTPGQNELDFCARYMRTNNPPSILWPLDFGHTGPFAHIGSLSLSNVQPLGVKSG